MEEAVTSEKQSWYLQQLGIQYWTLREYNDVQVSATVMLLVDKELLGLHAELWNKLKQYVLERSCTFTLFPIESTNNFDLEFEINYDSTLLFVSKLEWHRLDLDEFIQSFRRYEFYHWQCPEDRIRLKKSLVHYLV